MRPVTDARLCARLAATNNPRTPAQFPKQLPPTVTWIACAIIAVTAVSAFIAIELSVLHAGFRDYDEGVYWQSLRAMGRGERLFGTVFASQPPAFYYAMLPYYLVGHSIFALRLGILVFSAAGLAATYVTGRMLAGPVAGLLAAGLLATSSLYIQQGAVLQADAPAAALSVATLAFLAAATRANGRRRWLLGAAAGACLAFALGTKLSGALVALPAALILWQAPRPRGHLPIAFVLGVAASALILLIPMLEYPQAAFDNLIHSHLAAGQALHQVLGTNLRLLLFKRELPLEGVAAALTLVALLRHDHRILPIGVWAAASVIAILLYQPLFPHHVVMLLPSLALLTGIGLVGLSEAPLAVTTSGLALVTLTAGLGVGIAIGDANGERHAGGHEALLAASLRAHTHAGDFIISDNPYAVALADRDIPGPVVDTSHQRIAAELLSVADLDAASRRYHVQFVLVDGARLPSVPGFTAWLNKNYSPARYLSDGASLYAR